MIKVNILMVGPFPQDLAFIKGGVQASVYGLSQALMKRDDVGSVKGLSLPIKADSASATGRGKIGEVDVTYLTAPFKYQVSSVLRLPVVMKLIRETENPVVHVHGSGLFQAPLLAVMRAVRIPFVWTLHGIAEKEMLQRCRDERSLGNWGRYYLYKFLEGISLRLSPVIIVDTPYVREEIPATRNTVRVIPQGIFTHEFEGLPVPNHDDPPLVFSLGVLAPRKSHHLAIEAFAVVNQRIPSARLVIAGAAPVSSYYQSLMERVTTLGLTGCVEIRADAPRQEILALLGRASVFALHSQEESQGIALCEALAAGLPVVATRVGGIPFVVDDQKSGFLVNYGDVESFAARIIDLLSDKELRIRMAGQAKRSSARFDWDAIAGEIAGIYGKLSAEHCGRPEPLRFEIAK